MAPEGTICARAGFVLECGDAPSIMSVPMVTTNATVLPAPVAREHAAIARSLVAEAHADGGLAPVDMERFWADQEAAAKDPFGASIPQVPIGTLVTGECVYDELGMPEDYWRYDNDPAWRVRLNQAYNDKAEKIIGCRPLSEEPDDPSRRWPEYGKLHDLFEARNVWHDRSWWLMPSASTEDQLRALLDRVERRLGDVRGFILPAGWDAEKKRLLALGVEPPWYRWQRGPVTFAMSVFGVESLIYLIDDGPDLAIRFRDLILRGMLEIARVLDEEAGHTQQTSPRGFGFADDNSAMLTPAMYELFGEPVLRKVWEVYSPGERDRRYQHSDSAMGHLLPILGRLKLTGCNFGPTIPVSEIRRHLPDAVIEGQLAPFTYSRNEEEGIVAEFLRDFHLAREKRGLKFATAGSVNNGSRLTGMRLIMAAVQRYGRY